MGGDCHPDLSVEAAQARLLDTSAPVVGVERLALTEALGRVLAEPVWAPIALPREDHSALDGYAIDSVDGQSRRRLRIVGRALAGEPWPGTVVPGTCVRIMTGAMLPAGANTVVAQESVQAAEGWITLDTPLTAGDNVRRVGEDVPAGAEGLAAGCLLDARRIALLAALGLGAVVTHRTVRVGLLSTGSELRGPGTALARGEQYDSNRPMLAALLQQPCVRLHDLGTVVDDPNLLSARLAQIGDLDRLVANGGVSGGEADWVRPVLAERGQLDFWRVAVKPGRPLAFGRLGACWFMGLPGNPVSAYVTHRLFVQPVLQRLAGLRRFSPAVLRAPLLGTVRHRPGRTSFLRGRWEEQPDGETGVVPLPKQGSAMLSSLTQADCLIELPAEQAEFAEGTPIRVWPL